MTLDDCDPGLTDVRGNAPIHYLIRMRVKEGDEFFYTQLVRDMMALPKLRYVSHTIANARCDAQLLMTIAWNVRQPLLHLKNKKEETILHVAALACNTIAVALVLDLKANPNALNMYVHVPQQVVLIQQSCGSIRRGSIRRGSIRRGSIRRGSIRRGWRDIDIVWFVRSDGETALHFAARSGSADVVRILMAHGVCYQFDTLHCTLHTATDTQ
jgi:hypothetical protein